MTGIHDPSCACIVFFVLFCYLQFQMLHNKNELLLLFAFAYYSDGDHQAQFLVKSMQSVSFTAMV